ncbi:hypothetical protein QEZ54_35565 [Catellatospora sp. KI3]|uniref:hypothetical protein n=1 Tax=Catellatospora sp. KI3 TaxID=3041620 RepID=UPI00248220D3|nr:hypothetical protein [Catellatospora sp. KI3]MDI1466310.1 hypothetical protein [Catellatospora sp. KI3]
MTADPTGTPDIVEAADAVLSTHVADEFGFCEGCLAEYGIATPHPCTAHQWATRTYVIAGEPAPRR